jgi:hypothetical protein
MSGRGAKAEDFVAGRDLCQQPGAPPTGLSITNRLLAGAADNGSDRLTIMRDNRGTEPAPAREQNGGDARCA